MKAKIVILVFISLLLVSCVPATPTQDHEVVEIATEEIITEAPIKQEPVATVAPTEGPTESPLPCVTLLTPINSAEIPPVGKITFSWTSVDEAVKYVLNIILPSGYIVLFETKQTFYYRYMEAFVAGGKYQWKVVAQKTDGSEICVSKISTFDKPTYKDPNGDGSGNGGSDSGGSDGGCGLDGCSYEQ